MELPKRREAAGVHALFPRAASADPLPTSTGNLTKSGSRCKETRRPTSAAGARTATRTGLAVVQSLYGSCRHDILGETVMGYNRAGHIAKIKRKRHLREQRRLGRKEGGAGTAGPKVGAAAKPVAPVPRAKAP